MAEPDERRAVDLVVIGGSAGGVEALRSLASYLPGPVGAPVVIVLHVAPAGPSVMPEILTRNGPNPARHATEGLLLRPGEIVVAPPDHHVLIDGGRVRLDRGPRENGSRPSVDPLFRTAAAAYGSRVLGVLMSGSLDDGVEGLRAIAAAGGHTLVQDPEEAAYPSMPIAALEAGVVTDALPVEGIAKVIAELTTGRPPVDRTTGTHATDDSPPRDPTRPGEPPGSPSGLTCPNCHGALWVDEANGGLRFTCRTGHAFGPDSLFEEQSTALDEALWGAYRALLERAELSRRLAERARQRDARERDIRRYEAAAELALEQARLLRSALAGGVDNPDQSGNSSL